MINNNNITRKLLIYFGFFLSAVLLVSLIIWLINKDNTSTLEILVAPSSSNILINGKKYTNGTYHIKPGEYNIEISKDGFKSYSGGISTQKDTVSKLSQALLQNDGSYSWYLEHQDDDLILSAIVGEKSDNFEQKLVTKYPILQYIPYIDNLNGNYKIDAQIGDDLEYLIIYPNTCDPNYIESYKTEALNWIKSKNINPDDYIIKYKNLCDESNLYNSTPNIYW